MRQIILGTAGHIDHGKTSLIKAVTGINTDRLKEEQDRGITIELGFASLDLPSGQHVGIVDVPGHEKFVKNMVAGATGIDMVAMVIAADEGIMPQTREHMEICTLLGVTSGMVVLTKIDLVDEEWMELVQEEIADFTRDTFLDAAPVVPVSSATGQGIPDFVAALDDIASNIPERSHSTLFRLPVDRVFTMKGFGTVITGSLVSGRVRVGQNIEIYPSGIRSKVRGIQVHNESVEEAGAGLRTAINFQGLDKEEVNRGDVLSTPGDLEPTYMVDLETHFLRSNTKPMKNRTRVRFHTGTSEILGYLILLDREELQPGETAFTQIRLESAVALVKDDRFVIRSYSPIRTIGGGRVLNPIPGKHKRFRDETMELLNGWASGSTEEIVSLHIKAGGFQGVSFTHLRLMSNTNEKELDRVLQGLLSRKEVIQVDRDNRIFMHDTVFEQVRQDIQRVLDQYHTQNPLKPGIPKEELKSKLPDVLGGKLFTLVLNQMLQSKEIAQEGEVVRAASHTVSLAADQKTISKQIIGLYQKGALMPPYFKEVSANLNVDPKSARDVLMLLVDEGEVIKVKEDLYFHRAAIDQLQSRLVDFLKHNGEISTPQFKEMTGATRKYVIPLIEYFDAKNVTIRIGDTRKLRKQS